MAIAQATRHAKMIEYENPLRTNSICALAELQAAQRAGNPILDEHGCKEERNA